MARILMVDDNESFRAAIRKILVEQGHEVEEAEDGRVALQLYREQPTDVYMPGTDAIEATIRLQHEFPEAKVVVVSGDGYEDKVELLRTAATLGALRTLEKPVTGRTF